MLSRVWGSSLHLFEWEDLGLAAGVGRQGFPMSNLPTPCVFGLRTCRRVSFLIALVSLSFFFSFLTATSPAALEP